MTDRPTTDPKQDADARALLEKQRQDALDAWAEFQATGLHVTAEEADAASKPVRMPSRRSRIDRIPVRARIGIQGGVGLRLLLSPLSKKGVSAA